MTRKLFLICIIPYLLFGCSKEDVAPVFLVEEYSPYFTVNMYEDAAIGNHPKVFTLKYDARHKPLKRHWIVGCTFPPCPPAEGYMFDTVLYQNNTIRILPRSSHPEVEVIESETLLKLAGANQIEYRVFKLSTRNGHDSVRYHYSNARLDSLSTYRVFVSGNSRKENTKYFRFDAAGNLAEVETREYSKDSYTPKEIIQVKTEMFGGYDTAPNPFQALFMFDDSFYRSLSKNNFTTYQVKIFETYSNTTTYGNKRSWQLTYDTRGVPVFIW
ncbi:hypothetical protein [Rufibacter immobilis]|uniref:hypothetical protein n=1 Tax=Rufibacter immobilis TaxID=1348778 RepID=UPI0035E99A67